MPVFRLDADTRGAKDAVPALLARFAAAPAGLLVGTQMVAKGHDFPDVTLGVVVDADATLRFPDFRAEERTFALIAQLAGPRRPRAARRPRARPDDRARRARDRRRRAARRARASSPASSSAARARLPAVRRPDPDRLLRARRRRRARAAAGEIAAAAAARAARRCSARRRCSGCAAAHRSQVVVKAHDRARGDRRRARRGRPRGEPPRAPRRRVLRRRRSRSERAAARRGDPRIESTPMAADEPTEVAEEATPPRSTPRPARAATPRCSSCASTATRCCAAARCRSTASTTRCASEIRRMGQLMHDALGIGLAATQVGVMHRVLVYRVEPDGADRRARQPACSSGPSDEREAMEEGCLSLPGVLVEVERPSTSACARRTSAARRILIEASGLEARVIQHEMDHLDGVLILDRTSRDQRKQAMRTLRETARRRRSAPPPDAALRTVYLGTSEFAAAVLERLAASPHRPALVDHAPRPPAGRGRRSQPPPVADAARALGLELIQPEDAARARGARADRRRRARRAGRLRLRRADPRAAAERLRDPQRAPVAAAALARRGAGRAGDHGRRRARPASRSCA